MMKRTSDDDRRPVGSKIRRAARVRRATAEGIVAGREKATAVLLAAARARAIPVRMPTGLHTARTAVDRAQEWVLNTAARFVARKIERSTFKAAVNKLESLKVGGLDWEKGIWTLVNVMKGNIAV
jgi:hypothetical protein